MCLLISHYLGKECKIQEGRKFCLFCLLMSPQDSGLGLMTICYLRAACLTLIQPLVSKVGLPCIFCKRQNNNDFRLCRPFIISGTHSFSKPMKTWKTFLAYDSSKKQTWHWMACRLYLATPGWDPWCGVTGVESQASRPVEGYNTQQSPQHGKSTQ